MDYPSIATFISVETLLGDAFEAAVAQAVRTDAHLRVIAPGIDQTDPGFYYAGANAVLLRENADQAKAEGAVLRDAVHRRLEGETLRWDLADHVVQAPGLGRYIAEQTRFCDLFVLAAPYAPAESVHSVTALEAGLFEASAPTLVIPENVSTMLTPERILIGWNESDEALRATRAALPLLRRAHLAEIVIVDPPKHGPGRSDPGGALASYLSRHGVQAEVSVLARTESSVADILTRRAEETGAGMIVMGAYGHTRMREAIVGGATRHMLERAPLPVLMAH